MRFTLNAKNNRMKKIFQISFIFDKTAIYKVKVETLQTHQLYAAGREIMWNNIITTFYK